MKNNVKYVFSNTVVQMISSGQKTNYTVAYVRNGHMSPAGQTAAVLNGQRHTDKMDGQISDQLKSSTVQIQSHYMPLVNMPNSLHTKNQSIPITKQLVFTNRQLFVTVHSKLGKCWDCNVNFTISYISCTYCCHVSLRQTLLKIS